MEIRDLLFFDKMLAPTVITVLYWIFLVLCVLGGLATMVTTDFFSGLLVLLLGPLFVRIWCELIIVAFKANEALQEIRRK